MKLLLTVALLIISPTLVLAQPAITLSKTLGGSKGQSIRDIVADADGNLIALCKVDSNDEVVDCNLHGDGDIWLVKMDGNANIIWQKCYGGSDVEEPYQIITTTDSGFLFVSKTWSTDGDITFNHGLTDIWLVKTDIEGNIQWEKSIGSSAGENPYHLMQLTDGRYLLACYTLGSNGDFPLHYGSGFDSDAWIVFINTDGSIDTGWRYGGTSQDYIADVLVMPNGDYVMFGSSESQDYDLAGTSPNGLRDGWIFRTDSNGNILWTKRWGGNFSDVIVSAVPLSDGGFLTAGDAGSTLGEFSVNHGPPDIWIMKLDAFGNKLNMYCYGGGNIDAMDWRMRMHSSGNGRYIIGARTGSNDGDVGFHYGNNTLEDFWFLTVDSNGILIDSKVFGGSGVDDLYSNNIIAWNKAILGGVTTSSDGDIIDFQGGADGWLIKVDGFNMIGKLIYMKNEVIISPNPLRSEFVISLYTENKLTNAILFIYSIEGKLLLKKKIKANREKITVPDLPPGFYPYSLLTDKGEKITSGNLIIQ